MTQAQGPEHNPCYKFDGVQRAATTGEAAHFEVSLPTDKTHMLTEIWHFFVRFGWHFAPEFSAVWGGAQHSPALPRIRLLTLVGDRPPAYFPVAPNGAVHFRNMDWSADRSLSILTRGLVQLTGKNRVSVNFAFRY
jgi:hypothetical protein